MTYKVSGMTQKRQNIVSKVAEQNILKYVTGSCNHLKFNSCLAAGVYGGYDPIVPVSPHTAGQARRQP